MGKAASTCNVPRSFSIAAMQGPLYGPGWCVTVSTVPHTSWVRLARWCCKLAMYSGTVMFLVSITWSGMPFRFRIWVECMWAVNVCFGSILRCYSSRLIVPTKLASWQKDLGFRSCARKTSPILLVPWRCPYCVGGVCETSSV